MWMYRDQNGIMKQKTNVHVYIHIERERERDTSIHIHACLYTHIYTCIRNAHIHKVLGVRVTKWLFYLDGNEVQRAKGQGRDE